MSAIAPLGRMNGRLKGMAKGAIHQPLASSIFHPNNKRMYLERRVGQHGLSELVPYSPHYKFATVPGFVRLRQIGRFPYV